MIEILSIQSTTVLPASRQTKSPNVATCSAAHPRIAYALTTPSDIVYRFSHRAGVCHIPQRACGPYSATAWPAPSSHPLESAPPQQSEPFLSRAESWSSVLGTSPAATVEVFKTFDGDSHRSLFSWGGGSGVTSLGAEACSCGDQNARACRSCHARGGRVAGPKTPPGSRGGDALPIGSAFARVRRHRVGNQGLAVSRLGSYPNKNGGNPGLSISEAPVRRLAPCWRDAVRSLFLDVHFWETASEPEPHISSLFEPYGGPESAVSLLDRSLHANPGDPSLWNDLGNAHRALGSAGVAAECFRMALELQPHPDVFLNLGSVVFRAGRWNEARELFEAGLQRDGRHALLMFALASTHAALGRLVSSREAEVNKWLRKPVSDPCLVVRFAGAVTEKTLLGSIMIIGCGDL